MSPSLRLARFFLAVSLFLLAASAVRAQVPSITNLTSTPVPGVGHDYTNLLSETVAPLNGAVSIRISMPTPPGRRMKLPFSIAYDSNGIYYTVPGLQPNWTVSVEGYQSLGGWSNTLPMVSYQALSERIKTGPSTYVNCPYLDNFIFYDSYGTRHKLPISHIWESSQNGACPLATPPNFNPGTSFGLLYSPIPVVATAPDGTVYNLVEVGTGTTYNFIPNFIEDANGNKLGITANTANGGAFTISDELSRTLVSSSGFGSTGNTVNIAGLASGYTFTWATASLSFTTSWTLALTSPQGCNTPTNTTGGPNASSISAISAITLPNGKQYTFTYDPTYGTVSQVTYPSGGWVKYQWGLNTQSEALLAPDLAGNQNACGWIYDRPAILHRYVSFDGVNTALQQDLTYSTTFANAYTVSGHNTTVTTHDLVRGTTFQTVYTGDANLQELAITYKDLNGSTLRTVSKGWYDRERLACELTTLDNGLLAATMYGYGPGGQVTDKKEYDYGVTTSASWSGVCPASLSQSTDPPGPSGVTPTRETVTTYQSFSGSPLFAPFQSPNWTPILDRPCPLSPMARASGSLRLISCTTTLRQYAALRELPPSQE